MPTKATPTKSTPNMATPTAVALKSKPKAKPEATPVATTTQAKKAPAKRVAPTPIHPLAKFIPPMFFYDNYIGRDVGGKKDLDVMAAAHRLGHNVLLSGPTGAAKTTMVYAYAAKIGMPLINVSCNGGINERQLIGGWQPTPSGGYHFVPGDLVRGVQEGAIILLNEVNFMPPKIAAVVYPLLDRRRMLSIPDAAGSDFPTEVYAADSTFVVSDYNPGYIGTRPLNQAFRNRFAVKMPWGYDHNVELQLLNSPTLLSLMESLRKRAEVGDITTPVSTNMAMEFEEFVFDEALGFEFAVQNFVAAFDQDERLAVTELMNNIKEQIMDELFEDATDDA